VSVDLNLPHQGVLAELLPVLPSLRSAARTRLGGHSFQLRFF
jgi:hypothetical protein